MEKFLNLKFMKYPITLVISMITCGFILYIFPVAASEGTITDTLEAYGKISTELPATGNPINAKDVESGFGDDSSFTFMKTESFQPKKDSVFSTPKSPATSLDNRMKQASINAGLNSNYTSNYKRERDYSYEPVGEKRYKKEHSERIENLDRRIESVNATRKNNEVMQNIENNSNEAAPSYFTEVEAQATKESFKERNNFYSNNQKNDYNYGVNGAGSFVSKEKAKKGSSLIKAKVYESKTVRNGSSVKIIIGEDKTVAGLRFEAGQIVSAKANIANDRLYLSIESGIFDGNYQSIDCAVIDLDGQKGLKITADYNTDLQKKSFGQSLGGSLSSVNPLLVYSPQGNLANTVANQVVGSLTNQALNGANQYANAKMADFKVNLKTGHNCYLIIKAN